MLGAPFPSSTGNNVPVSSCFPQRKGVFFAAKGIVVCLSCGMTDDRSTHQSRQQPGGGLPQGGRLPRILEGEWYETQVDVDEASYVSGRAAVCVAVS